MYYRSALILFCLAIHSDLLAADPVHVLIWDERQPRQSQAYDNFLDSTFLADRVTSIRQYLADNQTIMTEDVPAELAERYGG